MFGLVLDMLQIWLIHVLMLANFRMVSIPTGLWIPGASTHMTPTASNLDSAAPYRGNDRVVVGNGHLLNITHTGSCSFSPYFKLLNVMAVPYLTRNLLSISHLTTDYEVDVLFSKHYFVIQNRKTGLPVAQGRRDGGLYILQRAQSALLASLKNKSLHGSFTLWHARLGHIGHSIISLLQRQGHLSVSSLLPDPKLCTLSVGQKPQTSFHY